MDKELYIGVDVSKQTLDLAYYDGESIDWKKAHIKVSNNNASLMIAVIINKIPRVGKLVLNTK